MHTKLMSQLQSRIALRSYEIKETEMFVDHYKFYSKQSKKFAQEATIESVQKEFYSALCHWKDKFKSARKDLCKLVQQQTLDKRLMAKLVDSNITNSLLLKVLDSQNWDDVEMED